MDMTLTTRLAHIGGFLTLALESSACSPPARPPGSLSITPVGRLGSRRSAPPGAACSWPSE
ncbi:MAG: hypothetical protein U5R48_19175 [Gammaproteobacteria bacterium]|nr:hypothetical protein [Gammaproteobacteria bacterium]